MVVGMAVDMVAGMAAVVDSQAVLATVVDTAVAGPTEHSTVEVGTAGMAAGPIGVAVVQVETVVDTETFVIPFYFTQAT
jgi:hypothetical protein